MSLEHAPITEEIKKDELSHKDFKFLDQVIYNDGYNTDYGFIGIVSIDGCFCHFWKKGYIGKELRTRANVEKCEFKHLIKENSVEQKYVQAFAILLDYPMKQIFPLEVAKLIKEA